MLCRRSGSFAYPLLRFETSSVALGLSTPLPPSAGLDGSIDGILAGYWDIANVFDFLTEVYIGPIHLGRAAANNIGYMCSGVYHALPKVADGHPDPETGQCTSMSTVIKFAAVPAFVIKDAPGEVASR